MQNFHIWCQLEKMTKKQGLKNDHFRPWILPKKMNKLNSDTKTNKLQSERRKLNCANEQVFGSNRVDGHCQ